LGRAENSAFLGWETWLTPRYTPLPDMCYHVEFGSSASKGVCINRKEHPKLESARTPLPCGRGVADPRVILSNLVVLGQTVRTLLRRTAWKLSRLLRSFTVIGTNTDRSAAHDFPLTFRSNHGPISYRFRHKRRFQSKM